jgi:hypothetical protein
MVVEVFLTNRKRVHQRRREAHSHNSNAALVGNESVKVVMSCVRSGIPLFRLQDTIDVNSDFAICIGFLHFVGGGVSGVSHGTSVIVFGFRIEWAFSAACFVLAMGCLTKMRVVLDSLLAKVAYICAAPAGNLVAAIAFDEALLASRALANHCCRDRFFYSQPSLGFLFLFNFVAAGGSHGVSNCDTTTSSINKRRTYRKGI